MKRDLPDCRAEAAKERARLREEGEVRLLETGRAWDLAPTLWVGGSVIFPHAGLGACGHQIAAAVHAFLESHADCVSVLGLLHALTQELDDARAAL